MPPVDSDTLRTLMRQWATGIAILTVRDGAATHGMTVNSFTSVSLDPPLILVCIERTTHTHALVEHARAFAISILNQQQRDLSDRFSRPTTETGDRLAGLATHTAHTGAPILADTLGYVDCVVVAAHPTGTHTIFVAEVVVAQTLHEAPPLIYHDRQYRHLAD